MNIQLQSFFQVMCTLIFTLFIISYEKFFSSDEDYKENVIENKANCY